MSKIIVERPRLGGGNIRRGCAQDPDYMLSQECMKRPYVRQHVEKQLNHRELKTYGVAND
jgi:hypothetical protein